MLVWRSCASPVCPCRFFAMMNFVNPGLLGTLSTFQRVFAQPIEASREADAAPTATALGDARAAQLSRTIAPFQLRRLSTVNSKYLPPCVRYVVFCRPTAAQLTTYKKTLSDQSVLNRLLNTSAPDSTQVLGLIGKLRQICNHPDLVTLAPEVRCCTPKGHGMATAMLCSSAFSCHGYSYASMQLEEAHVPNFFSSQPSVPAGGRRAGL